MTFDAGRIRHDDGLMHYARMSNGAAVPSNWIRSTDGTTAATWRPESAGTPSYGSNSNEVSYANAPGASSLASRADHVHRGVTSLAHASNTYTGPVTLETEGSLYIVKSAANTYRLGSTGTGGGGGGSGSLTIEEPDSAPTVSAATKLVVPATRLSVSGTVATLHEDPIISLFGAPATAYDFDTSSLTGLTAMGTATAEDANTTIPGHLYLKRAATSSVALTGRHAAIPGAYPWTAIAKLTDHTPYFASFIRYGGLYIAESSPGKVEAIHMLSNGSLVSSLVAYTNPTTFSATIGTDRAFNAFRVPIYYAIVANSSTSFDYYVSQEGMVWLARQTARNPGFTVANCGVLVDPEQTAFAAVGVYDFLYFYTSALTLPG